MVEIHLAPDRVLDVEADDYMVQPVIVALFHVVVEVVALHHLLQCRGQRKHLSLLLRGHLVAVA